MPNRHFFPRCMSHQVVDATHNAMEFWRTDCRHYFIFNPGKLIEELWVSIYKWILVERFEVSKANGISSLKPSRLLATTRSSAQYMLYHIRETFNVDHQLVESKYSDFFQQDVIRFQTKGRPSITNGRASHSDFRFQKLVAVCVTERSSQLIRTNVIPVVE